ncbi:RagB/SusD family nutrient uptake outer membrane protein [Phaeodactylibacter luteus]|uniref:RagB/SusD family nutrient uptake outer membrane protein n=1 Tax=Phaeodactylibacter luteus TaxID=1564516 RepID=A0A5C6RG47_9BACT|nr:RagB/SusD family nutrient uptake outer membrane protein [Phaeodactylibacter luteus]TXB61306.1 RagB/SusD family nutrient uptake outer membrane protein [Phaeodactylibacter luteus]
MNNYKYVLLFFLAASLAACENFANLDKVSPQDQIETDLAVTDLNSARAALNGVYNRMQDADIVFDGWLATPQYFSDEAIFTGTFPTRLEFGNFNVFPSNTTMATVFSDFYRAINVANNIIELIPTIDDPSLTDAVVNDIVGQARFVRGLTYFYLTQGWGDVPLVTKATSGDALGDELNVPANPRAEVLDQVIADFEFARDNITETSFDRANAAAAEGMLARVYLVQGRYGEALTAATNVLGEGFDLTTVPYLQDQLFALTFTPTDGNSLNFFYGPAEFGGRHSIEPSAKLIGAFEPGDARFASSIDTASASVPFSLKYRDFVGANAGTDPILFLRHAELVLIAAEAEAEAGNFGMASMWLNQVRARAGLDPITLDASNYVDAILQERFVELSMESGHRLWDLRRRGMAEEVLGPLGYESCDAVWPLPLRDVDRNINLQQNNCCNC